MITRSLFEHKRFPAPDELLEGSRSLLARDVHERRDSPLGRLETEGITLEIVVKRVEIPPHRNGLGGANIRDVLEDSTLIIGYEARPWPRAAPLFGEIAAQQTPDVEGPIGSGQSPPIPQTIRGICDSIGRTDCPWPSTPSS